MNFVRTRPSTADFVVILQKLISRNYARLCKVNTRLKEYPLTSKTRKTTRLGTVRKPDVRLTDSPEQTMKVMVDTHFTSLNAPLDKTMPRDTTG